MLFQQRFLDGIRKGSITLAFRRWRRPSVRGGGTLLTPAGQLSIVSVTEVALSEISETDARRAGHASLAALRRDLQRHAEGRFYKIELGSLRTDPRLTLRESAALSEEEQRHLLNRLARLDAHASQGPWTLRTLQLIGSHPGVRAADLCRLAGQEKDQFKLNVRKLKNLGLTESLEIGYRLSPRGVAVVNALPPTDPKH
jgi:hypothetical protein